MAKLDNINKLLQLEYFLFKLMCLVQQVIRKINFLTISGRQRPFLQKVIQVITHPLCGKIFKRMAPKMVWALLPITVIIKKVYQTSASDTNSPVSISKSNTFTNLFVQRQRKKLQAFTTAFYHELKDLDPETRNEIIEGLIPCPLIPIIEPCFEDNSTEAVTEQNHLPITGECMKSQGID